jgi:dTDP-glucose pyrophosphorylase
MSNSKPIAIVPAAGQASRLWRLPVAKELLPVGFTDIGQRDESKRIPKVVSQYLLDQLQAADVEQVLMILTSEKLDLARHYQSGVLEGLDLAYLLVDDSESMPHSIARGFSWYEDRTVVFGMPDTIFTPPDALKQLVASHHQSGADLTLGLFRTEEPWRFGMVAFHEDGSVSQCIDKPAETSLEWMWGAACWEPSFSRLLFEQLTQVKVEFSTEPVLGDFFRLAVENGMDVNALPFEEGSYYDIGTPASYAHAIRTWQLFNAPDEP